MILPPHNRGGLTAAQWKRIVPLLPPQKPAVGRPNKDHQKIINGILWVLLSGCSLAGYPRALWSLADYLRTLLSLAETGNMADPLPETTTASRAVRENQLENPRSLMAALGHQHAAGAIRVELDPNSE